MTFANIFEVDYTQISSAIQSFIATDQHGNDPNFIVMSLNTFERVQNDNLRLMNSSKTRDFSHMIMGVPIAISDTLELGEIMVV